MIQLLPGLRIKVSNKHSTYGRVKVKSIQLFLGKYSFSGGHSGQGQNGHFHFRIVSFAHYI